METRARKKRVRFRTTAAVMLLAATAAYAAVKVCEAPLAEIRTGKKSISDVVATVKKGDSLEVIEKDKRGWLKVKVNGKEGYVYESALDAPKTRGLLASGDPRASETELAAAGKGVLPGTVAYASGKNLNTAGLEKMLETRRGISEAEFNSFVAEGKLKGATAGRDMPQKSEVAVAGATVSGGH